MAASTISIEIEPATTSWKRLEIFLGHHDFRVYLTDSAYVDVGRGSLAAALWVVPDPLHVGSLGTIGQFCEFAECKILVSGEHENDRPVNLSLNGVSVLRHMAGSFVEPVHPLSIGNGVVISIGAKVLAGAAIGDGAVVGAGAIVTRDAEAFGVYAGVPSRKLRDRAQSDRIAAARWWDWSMTYLMARAADLQTAAVTDGPHEYRAPTPRFVIRVPAASDRQELNQTRLVGFMDGDTMRPLTEAPTVVQGYVQQALGAGPHRWAPDVWALT